MSRNLAGLVVAALSFWGCGEDPELSLTGAQVFRTPVDDGNTFACATCHAVSEPTSDGIRRPGHPLADAAARPHFKNGRIDTLRGAVNSCLTEWMAAEPWTETDARWTALRGFLENLAPEPTAPALTYTVVPPPTSVSSGDPVAGNALFNQTCVVCHGADGIGTERGPRLAGVGHEPDFVALRTRTSGDADSVIYDGLTGGRMPFWAADRLSDIELLDIAAYVHTSPPPSTLPPDGSPPPTGEPRVCTSTHPKVGQSATLSMRAHGVRGTARIVDDCTIVLENFSYDGGGIDVRIYGGVGGDYDGGFAIGSNILGMPYDNGTLTVQLSPGRTLDDLDGVSVWCVAASTSFGDAIFSP